MVHFGLKHLVGNPMNLQIQLKTAVLTDFYVIHHTTACLQLREITDNFWIDGVRWLRGCGFYERNGEIHWHFTEAFLDKSFI
jgi:hypothetical protein